jgi:hypothetical protein
VSKKIICKTFHEALDVLFAMARYRIACKGFVTGSQKEFRQTQILSLAKNSYRLRPCSAPRLELHAARCAAIGTKLQ